MKRFQFKLQALLEIKKRAEDDIKKKLGAKNREILSSRQERVDLGKKLESFFVEEKQQRLRVLDLLSLRFSISYRSHLQKEIIKKEQDIRALMLEQEQLRGKLAFARKQSRVLELLKEKKLLEWKKEYQLEEREFADDISQKGFIRRMHAAEKEARAID